ncbi:MAG: Flp pilus assembly protein CpaB [Candidatus Margulisiibacteriota bacterium]
MVNKKILLLALILAAITTFAVFIYMKSMVKQTAVEEVKKPVLIAKVNIPTKTILKPEMLQIKEIPEQYVPGGVVSKIEDANGKVLIINAIPGQMLFEKDIKEKEANLGLSFIIPEDKRAVSVKVDTAAGVAGLIKPGDMVDILLTLHEQEKTFTVLQNIQVLAIGQETEMKKQSKSTVGAPNIITFAIGLKDAEKLILAEHRGPLTLALRSVQDVTTINTYGTNLNSIIPVQTYRTYSTTHRIQVIKGTAESSTRVK